VSALWCALCTESFAGDAPVTIGTPTTAAKPEIVPSLFVLNSRGATLQGDTLTLTGVMPQALAGPAARDRRSAARRRRARHGGDLRDDAGCDT